jgi:hypothetical protein
MPLDRVKAETSASQFALWMEFFEWETNAFDKTCYYLAQIAAEVRRAFAKNPRSVRIQDFILQFKSASEQAAKQQSTGEMQAALKMIFDQTKAAQLRKRNGRPVRPRKSNSPPAP